MNRTRRFLSPRAGIYLGLFAVFLLFNSRMVFWSDDLRFLAAPEQYGGIGNWFAYYYQNWSGRVLHLVFVLVARMPIWVFRTLNALFLAGLAFCLEQLAACFVLPDRETPALPALTLAAGALAVCTSSLFNTVLWGCSTVLYLWGLTLCFITVWVLCLALQGREIPPVLWGVAAVCACFAPYAEQPAATLLGYLLVLLAAFLLTRRHIPLPFWPILALAAVNSAVNLAAPGNGVRTFAETISRWPDYGGYSLWRKLALGLSYGLDALTGPLARYGFILAALLALRLLLCRRWLPMLLAGVCAGYWALAAARDFVPALAGLFAFVPGNDLYAGGPSALPLTWLALFFWFLLCGVLLTDGETIDWGAGVTGLAVLANLVLMGFTPSIYASLERPFYVSNILLNLLSLRQLVRIARESRLPRGLLWVPAVLLAVYGLFTMYRALAVPVG